MNNYNKQKKQCVLMIFSILVVLQFVILSFFWASDYLIVKPFLALIIYILPFFNLTLLLFTLAFHSAKKYSKKRSGWFIPFLLLSLATLSLIPLAIKTILLSSAPIIKEYTYKNRENIFLYITQIDNPWSEEKQDNFTLYFSKSNSKYIRKPILINNDFKNEILNQHFNQPTEIRINGSIYFPEQDK